MRTLGKLEQADLAQRAGVIADMPRQPNSRDRLGVLKILCKLDLLVLAQHAGGVADALDDTDWVRAQGRALRRCTSVDARWFVASNGLGQLLKVTSPNLRQVQKSLAK
jgi:hypothetical protein